MSVSVVITTCNRKELLARAIESVKAQTLAPIEILIIDDCSDDGTIEKYTSHRDEDITFVSLPERSGANRARNTGIDMAKGDYIAFLDDDDQWVPEKLETQIQEMISQDAPVSHTALHNVTPAGKSIKTTFHPPVEPDNILKSLMIDNFMGSTSSIAVKRSFVEEFQIRFDEKLKAMQDYDFYIACFQHTNSIVSLNKALTIYQQDRSLFKAKTAASYEAFSTARSHLLKKYKDEEHVSFLRKSLNLIWIKKCIKYPQFLVGAVKALFSR